MLGDAALDLGLTLDEKKLLGGRLGILGSKIGSVSPTVTVFTLGTGQDTGSSATDGYTSDYEPLVTGTATPGSTVTIYADSTSSSPLGTGVANATTGAFSIQTYPAAPPIGLSDGVHALMAVATMGGVTGSPTSLPITIDTTPPAVTVSVSADNTSTPTLSGTGDANATVNVGVLAFDNEALSNPSTYPGGQGFADQVTVSADTTVSNFAVATIQQVAGNLKFFIYDETTGSFVYTSGPVPVGADQITGQSGNVTFRKSPTFNVTLATGHTYDLGAIGDQFTYAFYQNGGNTPITQGTITQLASNARFNNFTSPAKVGTGGVEYALQIFSSSGTTTASPTGDWSYSPAGLPGSGSTFLVSERDLAGNTNYQLDGTTNQTMDNPVHFTGTTPPGLTITSQMLASDTGTSNSDNITSDGSVTLSGTVSDPFGNGISGVEIFSGTTDLGMATVTGGSWTYSTTLAEGMYSLDAVASDNSSNTASTTTEPTIVVDATPPDTSLTAGPTGPTNNPSPTFTYAGTDPGGSGVDHYLISLDGAAFTSTAMTSQSYSGLSQGSHSFSVEAVDVAGNIDPTPATDAFTVDTIAPTLGTESSASASGTDINAGKVVTFTVGTSEPVTVTDGGNGLPTLALTGSRVATYTGPAGSGTSTSALTFSYTVQAGDNVPDLQATAFSVLPANTTIQDAAGNNADLSGFATIDTGVQLDTTAPTLGAESSASLSGTDIDAGKVVTFTVNTSEPVTVTNGGSGLPTLTLTGGRVATYTGPVGPGTSTSALTFSYTVQAGDNVSDLQATAFSALPTNTTIQDAAGNNADLSGFALIDTGVQLDTTAPTLSSVTASGPGITAGTGDLGAGKTVTLTVNTSEPVFVSGGTPTLALDDGGTAAYTGGSGTNTLTFSYTVAPSQNSADLHVTGTSLSGATIQDAAGNAFNLASAAVNPAGTLQIDTSAPVVAITSSGGLTSQSAQTISGTVDPADTGTTVTLSDNGTPLGTAVVQNDGSFKASVVLPNSGSNSIVARDTDAAGNTGSSSPVTYTLALAGPTVSITSPSLATNHANQTIVGSVKPANNGGSVTGTTVTLVDNGVAIGSATVQPDGSFEGSVTLPNQGPNSIFAVDTDTAGNTGASSAITDTLDSVAPMVLITSPAETSSQASQTITGQVTSGGSASVAGQAVTFTDNGVALSTSAPVTTDASGNFTAQVVLPNLGQNSIVATTQDSYGNAGASAAVLDVLTPPVVTPPPGTGDTTPPSVSVDPMVSFTSATNATLTGTVSDNVGIASVTLFADGTALGAATVNPDGTWSFSHEFAPGFHTSISAVATDTSGNSASAPSDFDLTTGTRSGIPGQPYTAYQDRYAADGTFLGQTFFKANGAELFASTYTALPNGGSSYTYSGGTFFKGKTYSSFVNIYDANDTLIEDIENNRNGSHTIGMDTIAADTSGQRVHSIGNDLFANNAPDTHFVFSRGFGHDTIEDFKVAGPGHDTIVLPSFDMGRLAQIIAGAHTVGGDTTIHVDKQDTITLVGVTKAELKAHPNDFTFHASVS